MGLREKLDPSSELYSAEEISEELDIPLEVIQRMQKAGIINPTKASGYFTFKTVQFIEKYWSASSNRMKII